MNENAPTLKDVAARAGVGKAAVSAALRGSLTGTRVSEATRKRILHAAAELRYSPNIIARGLKNQRLNLLGVTFDYPDPTWIVEDNYGINMLKGIIGGAHNSGYSTTLFHKPWDDAKNSATGFRGQGIDGFLVVAPGYRSDMVPGLAALGIPLVVISSSSDQYGVPSVAVDNMKGVRLVLNHLRSLGHRRIAHLTDSISQFDWVMRRETFLAMAEEAGIQVPPDYARYLTNAHRDRGFYHHVRYLMSLPEPPTAIFATNDSVAMEALDAARDLGLDVPGQLSIVGFDDDREGRRTTPPLTSVRYAMVEMGQTAAKLLIALIEGEDVPAVTHLFEPELVVRESTAPPSK